MGSATFHISTGYSDAISAARHPRSVLPVSAHRAPASHADGDLFRPRAVFYGDDASSCHGRARHFFTGCFAVTEAYGFQSWAIGGANMTLLSSFASTPPRR